jgi:uncharacterized protein YndB with AHSA1/START domain
MGTPFRPALYKLDEVRKVCKTIKQRVKFQAPAELVYKLLADSRLHTAFAGEKAVISRNVGGRFWAYDGHCTGINVDLVPGKRIVQAWRSKRFPEGIYSMAAFVLTPTRDGGTELVLTHRGVPKDLIPGIEKGWREFYWDRMKAYLKARTSR